jgi:hypothetical protein
MMVTGVRGHLRVRNIACNRFSPYARADLGHDAPQGHVRMVGPMSGTWQVTWRRPNFFRLCHGFLWCQGRAPAVLGAPRWGPLPP